LNICLSRIIGEAAVLGAVWTLGPSHGFAGQAAPVAAIDVSREVGLFAANPQGKFCLSINPRELKPGREIILIWVPVEGEPYKPEVHRGKIIAKLAAPCDDTNRETGDSSYRLEAGKLDNGKIYIAVAAQANNLRIAGGEIIMRFGAREISFRSCTSTEGLHFSAWSGMRPKEQLVWQRYYYLGYDVEPTCVERDVKEIKP
jgi:hypothetical protein